LKRTTIRMNDGDFERAKRRAAETGRTLTSLIEDAVREHLARHDEPRPAKVVKLRTVRGRGLRPNIDLDDSAGLRDIMDRRDGPR
jgi:hypothetical protein